MRAVRPSSWHTRHTGAIIKGQRTRDEWASTRGCGARARARRRGRGCQARRVGGAVAQPVPSELWGDGAVSGGHCLVGEGD
jgi:hypothetical protein